jgi:micrococcal nuclease
MTHVPILPRSGRSAVLVLLAAAQVLLASSGALAQPQGRFTARVVKVTDGDTIVVRQGARALTVRLHGIDAPEGGQAFSRRAATFLSELALGRDVQLEVVTTDRYGRLVCLVEVDGRDVGREMVRAGLAWHYLRYSGDPALFEAEREARAARRGLWREEAPVPPWEYRLASRSPTPGGPSTGPYRGHVQSRVVHAPGCEHYACRSCTARFETLEAARAAGYRPHASCVR